MPADVIDVEKTWKVLWTCEKYNDCPDYETALAEGRKPDAVDYVHDNLLTNTGITTLLKLLANIGSLNAYSNANAYIAVGDSTTSASASQTDLQASSNLQRNAMVTAFPSVSGQTITFKASYASGEANFAWQEFGVQNGSGTPNGTTLCMLNRKVQSLGTKVSGATWVLQVDITIS